MHLRSYESRDEAAVWTLHEWALRETGVDPADVPGTDDLRAIETAYLETGGEFVVGIVDSAEPAIDSADGAVDAVDAPAGSENGLAAHDGTLAAMGGYLPNRAGHGEERDRPGAAELHRMRVAPPYQRRGYGRRLLADLERRAKAAGFEALLATTSTRQSAALGFYRAHGYERTAISTAGAYELVHFEKEL